MYNTLDNQPILLVPTVAVDGGMRFLLTDKQLDVKGATASKLWRMLERCNGHRTVAEICKSLDMSESEVIDALSQLSQMGIVGDSREQYVKYHELSQKPSPYPRHLNLREIEAYTMSSRPQLKDGKVFSLELPDDQSKLFTISQSRHSCRHFSSDPLSLSQILCICNAGYGDHAVPSAGGLYPLNLFVVSARDQIDFPAGYYEYNQERKALTCYKKTVDIDQLCYCYDDETLAFNSPIQIVITANFSRHAYKYDNRGYRFTLMECGAVAQNISLYCAETGLASCELGGFIDEALCYELELPRNLAAPLLVIAVGKGQSKDRLVPYGDLLRRLESTLVKDDGPVCAYGISTFSQKDSSFFAAWARYSASEPRYGGATGKSYNEAVSKAIIEAYERYVSSIARVDYHGANDGSSRFIDPNAIAPLSDSQRRIHGLDSYKYGDSIDWTYDLSGKYLLPTDFVYYGHKHNSPRLFRSNSSGVAAYTDYDGAMLRALAELIERDAFLRCWHTRKPPDVIPTHECSQHVINRVKHWAAQKRKVAVFLLESTPLPVFLVTISSANYPCFVSGAAAAVVDLNKSIAKALQEAEYNLLIALRRQKESAINAHEIRTPTEHGLFYQREENFRLLSWLYDGKPISKPSNWTSPSLPELRKSLNAVFVDLTNDVFPDIKVVRAVSCELAPISFGYQMDYIHKSLPPINFDENYLPHFFA